MDGGYRRQVPELIAPTTRLHAAWLAAHDEWGPGLHEDGFGLSASDEVASTTGFATWVARLSDETAGPCVYRWIIEGDRVLGGIALRYGDNDFVHTAGHVGYGVRPSARGRGVATWALGRMLAHARSLGLDRVLAVCEVGNLASARTIERQGGVPEPLPDGAAVRRYWIRTGPQAG